MWSFIGDVLGFLVVLSIFGAIGFLIYTFFKKMRRGQFSQNQSVTGKDMPFSVDGRFWEIQHAFAKADVAKLKSMLGTEMLDAILKDLQPSTLKIVDVSFEVRLETLEEISIWYTFYEDGVRVDQVWHFDKIHGQWLLTGLENV